MSSSHLDVPVRRLAIHARFHLFGSPILPIRESYGVEYSRWSGYGHFTSPIYAGDAIWVANVYGCRLKPHVVAIRRESGRLPNAGVVSEVQREIVGSWRVEDWIPRFLLNFAPYTIDIPDQEAGRRVSYRVATREFRISFKDRS